MRRRSRGRGGRPRSRPARADGRDRRGEPRGGAARTQRTAPPFGSAMRLLGVHHVAVIASDYARSRRFYTETLGLSVVAETYRAERDSHKLDLGLPDGSRIELFTFPDAPPVAARGPGAPAPRVRRRRPRRGGRRPGGGRRGRRARPPRRAHGPAVHVLRRPGRAPARALRGGLASERGGTLGLCERERLRGRGGKPPGGAGVRDARTSRAPSSPPDAEPLLVIPADVGVRSAFLPLRGGVTDSRLRGGDPLCVHVAASGRSSPAHA